MLLIYIANLIITGLVIALLLIFKTFDNSNIILNTVLLALTLEIPSFYIFIANRKKLDKNDNELLVPSALITIFSFIVNTIFYSILIGINSDNMKLTILFSIIFNSIVVVLLLIVKSSTNYIRKQH